MPTDRGNQLADSEVTRLTLSLLLALWATIVWSPLARAATMYVDPTLNDAFSEAYDPGSRSCGAGNDRAHRTLAGATAVARAGDTVLIREGTYNEPLNPGHSGEAGNPITFRGYEGERVVITGPLRPAINLENRQHIVIEGLEISNVVRWLYAVNAHYNVIRSNTFKQATDPGQSSKTGLYFQDSTYNKILNNIIEDNTLDLLSFVNADRNLAEGNIMRRGRHALFTIRCGNYNVIRGNDFHNELQKIGEIYDCDNHAGYCKYDATKRNLIESNDFAYTPSSGNSSPYAGIQYAGQQGIIRRNRFYDTVGPAIQIAAYDREARHNTDNRIYHNVFYGTDYAGVEISGGDKVSGNVLMNNIFMNSRFVANDKRWIWWTRTLHGKPVQILAGRLDGFLLDNNAIVGGESEWLITYGGRSSQWHSQHPVGWWESKYPGVVRNTVQHNPRFADEAKRDFRLSQDSPMIDAGAFLTRTTGDGSGTLIHVEDASFFYDGYGIPGEVGDLVQLAGTTDKATIVKIDYDQNSLALDRPLSWSAGQGLHLAYTGNGPDIGAYEYSVAKTEGAPL